MKLSLRLAALALLAAGCTATTAQDATLTLHEPLPGLYTAGQPAAGDWAALKARGIHTVIDLRAAGELEGRDEAAEVREAGMDYLQIPVAGAEGINADNARRLHAALGAAHGGGVLVHCASSNRAGALLALEQKAFDGVSAEAALALGKRAGVTKLEPVLEQVLAIP